MAPLGQVSLFTHLKAFFLLGDNPSNFVLAMTEKSLENKHWGEGTLSGMLKVRENCERIYLGKRNYLGGI